MHASRRLHHQSKKPHVLTAVAECGVQWGRTTTYLRSIDKLRNDAYKNLKHAQKQVRTRSPSESLANAWCHKLIGVCSSSCDSLPSCIAFKAADDDIRPIREVGSNAAIDITIAPLGSTWKHANALKLDVRLEHILSDLVVHVAPPPLQTTHTPTAATPWILQQPPLQAIHHGRPPRSPQTPRPRQLVRRASLLPPNLPHRLLHSRRTNLQLRPTPTQRLALPHLKTLPSTPQRSEVSNGHAPL